QRLMENARIALHRGQLAYVTEVTAHILIGTPGCLPVRMLHRAAALRAEARGWLGRWLVRIVGLADCLWCDFWREEIEPRRRMAVADRVLARDPRNLPALELLAGAAAQLQWTGTAAFAWQ